MDYLMSKVWEDQVRYLGKIGMNLSHLYVLDILYNGWAYLRPEEKSKKLVIPQLKEVKLLRDRFLVDDNGITETGRRVYLQIRDIAEGDCPVSGKKKVKEVQDTGFREVWEAYPTSPNFKYKGMQFKSGRSLRSNYNVCEQLYNAIIAKGEVTKEQIVNAINKQVGILKEESFETGTNKLQYMAALEPYIRQEKFMSFLETEEETESNNNYGWA